MSPVASSRLLAGAILALVLGDPTDACTCIPRHPQTAFCQADVVIRGKFMGVTPLSPSGEEFPSWIRYEINVTKTYKGVGSPGDVLFIDSLEEESLCGYRHPGPLDGKEEYLIMAERQGEPLTISLCSFVRLWGRVPPSQRRGVSQAYGEGCACEVMPCNIRPGGGQKWDLEVPGQWGMGVSQGAPLQVVPCHSMPCKLSGNAQCPWTDGLQDWNWQGPQAERQACLPRPSQPLEDSFCAWETLEDSFSEATTNSPGL